MGEKSVHETTATQRYKKFPDLAGTLGAKGAWNVLVCESWKLSLSLLDDNQREHRHIRTNNATTNRLSLSLTITALTEALLSFLNI